MGFSLKKRVEVEDEVKRFHDSIFVADIHSHFLINGFYLKRDIKKELKPPLFYNPFKNFISLPAMKRGGINLMAFTVYLPGKPVFNKNIFRWTNKVIDRYEEIVLKSEGELFHCENTADIEFVKDRGKIGTLLAVEGGHTIMGSLENLEKLYQRGVRMLTLTHFTSNEFMDSNLTAPFGLRDGLNELGKKVVKKMNDLGMIIDIAHASEKGFFKVYETSTKPIISSHTGVRKLCNIKRNLSDDMIKAIADSNGVCGVILFPSYLKKFNPFIKTDVVIDHIAYIADLVGTDYISIGSDADGFTFFPLDLRSVEDYPVLTKRMLERGFSKEDVRKIWGENFLRVMKTVCG